MRRYKYMGGEIIYGKYLLQFAIRKKKEKKGFKNK